jgi:cephalosporin hydroxylase
MDRFESLIVREFHRLFYYGPAGGRPTYANSYWMGVPILKCPLDLWVYQELLNEIRPDLIIETGTYAGGSALYLAHLCDLLGNGNVVSVDIEARERPAHPRVSYLTGSSVDPAVLRLVESRVAGARKVMVILDSDHSFEHVCAELDAYSGFVTEDSYLIVEDTNLSGHPVHPEQERGPLESVRHFLAGNALFVPDRSREKYLVTFNPLGYLRRTGSPGAGDGEIGPVFAEPEAAQPERGLAGAVVASGLMALFEQMAAQRDRAASDLSTATAALVDAVGALAKIGAHGIALNEQLAGELARVAELGRRLDEFVRAQTPAGRR